MIQEEEQPDILTYFGQKGFELKKKGVTGKGSCAIFHFVKNDETNNLKWSVVIQARPLITPEIVQRIIRKEGKSRS